MANKKQKEAFRWTLFQDFDSGPEYDDAEREFQIIYSNATENKRGNLNIITVDLFPDYNFAGERMQGYRARIVVLGNMAKADQQDILMMFMRFGWHF